VDARLSALGTSSGLEQIPEVVRDHQSSRDESGEPEPLNWLRFR
jgi:hypothetical protein